MVLFIQLKSEYNIHCFITVGVCSLHGLTASCLFNFIFSSLPPHSHHSGAAGLLWSSFPTQHRGACCSVYLNVLCMTGSLPSSSSQMESYLLLRSFLPTLSKAPQPHRISTFIFFLVPTQYHDLKLS